MKWKTNIRTNVFWLALGALGWATLSAAPASAATIVVNDTSEIGSSSTCNYASAVEAANTNSLVNGCTAGDAHPAVDTIQLGQGVYRVDTYTVQQLSESVTVEGVSAGSSAIDTMGGHYDFADFNTSGDQHTLMLRNFRASNNEDGLFVYMSGYSRVNVELNGVELGNLIQSVQEHASGSLSIDNSTLAGVYIARSGTGEFPAGINNSILGRWGLNVENGDSDTSANQDTVLKNSDLDGGGDSYAGVYYDNQRPDKKLRIDNSRITGYISGVVNHECLVPFYPGSLYLTNSSVGGNGMNTGVVNKCGHTVVDSTTFHDINGSAILTTTNSSSRDPNILAYYASDTEVFNSTFTNIKVGGTYEYGAVGIPLSGVISNYAFDEEAWDTKTGSKLNFTHNTFANNDLNGMSVFSFDNAVDLSKFSLRNNAIEGDPISGTYTADENTVSNNLTTSTARAGIAHVDDFVLGPLKDNGGIAPIGVNGSGGNVLTMRPLAGSPLIDSAPYAGLDIDQRNGPRSLLNSYDVGAVEVTRQEYIDDGGEDPMASEPEITPESPKSKNSANQIKSSVGQTKTSTKELKAPESGVAKGDSKLVYKLLTGFVVLLVILAGLRLRSKTRLSVKA